jgi:hypothetical protein
VCTDLLIIRPIGCFRAPRFWRAARGRFSNVHSTPCSLLILPTPYFALHTFSTEYIIQRMVYCTPYSSFYGVLHISLVDGANQEISSNQRIWPIYFIPRDLLARWNRVAHVEISGYLHILVDDIMLHPSHWGKGLAGPR